jgi:hypothetical protein
MLQELMVNFSTLGLSTVAICESMHYGPMLWKYNHDEFRKCSTRKEKLEKQKKAHKDIIRIVGAYISLQMQWCQDRDIIWASYHFQ